MLEINRFVKVAHMESDTSRKKSQGRPKLDPLEKQRRLVARLYESCFELEHLLQKQSGHLDATDLFERHMLSSTYNQRLSLAREVAQHELGGLQNAAKEVRQKLNLFRPLGFTEESWNALPDDVKRLAPGKPKMPKELELARLEIERDQELHKLRVMEQETNAEPADLDQLQEQHGKTNVGRPGKDILGALDRQMHTAIYKRRHLVHLRIRELSTGSHDFESKQGRPRKEFDDRYDYFTSIIEHCHKQILDGEAKLPLLDLQRRLIKRLRDNAARIRLQIRTNLGIDPIRLKLDLPVIEKQIDEEIERLKYFDSSLENMADMQRESLQKSVADKIGRIDSLEQFEDFEDRHRLADESSIFKN